MSIVAGLYAHGVRFVYQVHIVRNLSATYLSMLVSIHCVKLYEFVIKVINISITRLNSLTRNLYRYVIITWSFIDSIIVKHFPRIKVQVNFTCNHIHTCIHIVVSMRMSLIKTKSKIA